MSDAQYDDILRKAVAGAAGTGPLIISPIPGTDLAAVTSMWVAMAVGIARKNNLTLDKKAAAKIVTAVLTGGSSYWGSAKTVMFVFSKIPGVGMVIGSGVNGLANSIFTLWFAFGLIDLFERKGPSDLESYIKFLLEEMRPRMSSGKVERAKAFFQRWIQSGRR